MSDRSLERTPNPAKADDLLTDHRQWLKDIGTYGIAVPACRHTSTIDLRHCRHGLVGHVGRMHHSPSLFGCTSPYLCLSCNFTHEKFGGQHRFGWSALKRTESDEALRFQEISALLIQERNVDLLYLRILDAAVDLMSSDMASIQLFHPERNELRLLAWKGFHPQSAAFWDCVRLESGSVCAAAF